MDLDAISELTESHCHEDVVLMTHTAKDVAEPLRRQPGFAVPLT